MDDQELQKAIDLLVEAEAIMNSLYVTIIDYGRSSGWMTFKKRFFPLKDRITKWQDKLWETDFIKPSPSASPSHAPEEDEING